MNNSALRLLSGAIIVTAFVASSVAVQFQKNREFRFRIAQLEAQIVEIKLRLDIHELPFPRRMDAFIIQPELPKQP